MRPSSVAFAKQYSDGSGVEFEVSLHNGKISFVSVNECSFPVEQLDWLISALEWIKTSTSAQEGCDD